MFHLLMYWFIFCPTLIGFFQSVVTSFPDILWEILFASRPLADWFTGLLVLVGALQFVAMLVQAHWMRKTLSVAQQSADAARDSVKVAQQSTDVSKATLTVAQESADAARDTVKAMKRTAQRELRARVFVESVQMRSIELSKIRMVVRIRNFGRVPAYKCTYSIKAMVRPIPLNETLIEPTITSLDPNFVLPPGGEIMAMVGLPDGTFANMQHQNVIAKSYAIYVFGKIEYRDGFRCKRTSRFLLKSAGEEYLLGQFSFCEQGNKAN